jgi:hypothetical protein
MKTINDLIDAVLEPELKEFRNLITTVEQAITLSQAVSLKKISVALTFPPPMVTSNPLAKDLPYKQFYVYNQEPSSVPPSRSEEDILSKLQSYSDSMR